MSCISAASASGAVLSSGTGASDRAAVSNFTLGESASLGLTIER